MGSCIPLDTSAKRPVGGDGELSRELKLLQPRKRRIVSETELRTIKQNLIPIEGERVLVQEAKSSFSILNVTRVDLTKNRQAINRLIKGV